MRSGQMIFGDFVKNFSGSLSALAERILKPAYAFDLGEHASSLNALKRPLFCIQKHAAAACAERLKTEKSQKVVGEMGCGKTTVAIAAAWLLRRRLKRVLILCPSHLIEKWEREIREILPVTPSVQVIRSIESFERQISQDHSGESPLFYILSKESAKLGYDWIASYLVRYHFKEIGVRSYLACPDCFKEITKGQEKIKVSIENLEKEKLFCRECGGALWQAQSLFDGRGKARFPIARFIQKKHKGIFDLLIVDEAHQFKSKTSEQGMAMGGLASASKKILALTGTIFGGRSSSIFHLLHRLDSQVRREFGFKEVSRWIGRYGIVKKIFTVKKMEEPDGSNREVRLIDETKELPGASPDLVRHILDSTIFIRLSDLYQSLPPFREHPVVVEMTPPLAEAYGSYESTILKVLKRYPLGKRMTLLAKYLQAMLTYADNPFIPQSILDPESGETIARGALLPESMILPKEKHLIDLCLQNKANGRKVLIYCTHTQTRDITPRLKKILSENGLRCRILKSQDVESEKRESYIQNLVEAGLDVLITHPRLVEVGLDLIEFPTILFFEVETSSYTVRQSSRRSLRFGQTRPVEVYYYCYKNTMQEKALALVAELVRNSVTFDGESFDERSLAGFRSLEDNVLKALSRSILENSSIMNVEEVFAKLREEDHPAEYLGGIHLQLNPEERKLITIAAADSALNGTTRIDWNDSRIHWSPIVKRPKDRKSTDDSDHQLNLLF